MFVLRCNCDNTLGTFFVLLGFLFVLETGSHCVALDVLGLIVQTRLLAEICLSMPSPNYLHRSLSVPTPFLQYSFTPVEGQLYF